MLHEALLYDQLEDGSDRCYLCAHHCHIRNGNRGICHVRENREGKLYSLVYGNLISRNVDPIEKKPLYHFLPGSNAYSIATPGCNFRCNWCQNWQISQMPRIMDMPQTRRVMPQEVLTGTINSGCKSIAYTYSEPTIFFEYSFDISKIAHQSGIKNVYVTNGFMTPKMLDLYSPYLDAANVDIKAFNDKTYRTLMGGRLEPVLDSCRKMKSLGIWLEVTTLIVPGVNDDLDELKALAEFIYNDLGEDTPWHLSRFYPQYKMRDRQPTEASILDRTKEIGEYIGLNYIYLGNIYRDNETKCKNCGFTLISRRGYSTKIIGMDKNGHCKRCGTYIEGVWD